MLIENMIVFKGFNDVSTKIFVFKTFNGSILADLGLELVYFVIGEICQEFNIKFVDFDISPLSLHQNHNKSDAWSTWTII